MSIHHKLFQIQFLPILRLQKTTVETTSKRENRNRRQTNRLGSPVRTAQFANDTAVHNRILTHCSTEQS